MIISNKQVQTVLQLNSCYHYSRRIAFADNSSMPRADVLLLSNKVQELNLIKEQVLKSPDIRADKVSELKELIQDGRYHVTGDEIAQKMINRSLVDELAGR
ncbi:FlgM family anti-sigma-28 factor [Hydrogenispora ethanolica]|jgi:negative regulator of flagellin synthesis FlgM|uniref:Negative regulator of flagellin synthesis n=1 Tax=Hydrogenispora ethanolica TaxID=1082276 RepID=A0A4R1RFQ8_HYDET|nr:flagellar biosynthesis anti-sigma factor FlgM [Hydrogenispora ethanolica]TCL64805.1 FlgM family anti-sigma-28 factor [Hydrogenispora ethanolica]